MASLCSYFVKNEKNINPPQRNIVRGSKYRFTILTPRLVRIEYNEKGEFENRPTSLVINRNFGDVKYSVDDGNVSITISTEYFTLTYVKNALISSKSLKVSVNGTDKKWYPGSKDVRNVGSINYSLDYLDNNLKLDKGLYSFDGYALLDDSKGFVIDNDMFVSREKTVDLYLFVYKNDLGLCLQDYFNLTGYPPMIPRYALGCWWYKNDKYNMYDMDNIIKKFDDNHIPISVFLLGKYWHNDEKNFTYDNSLFDLNNINNYYRSKKQGFGLTINPELAIGQNDELYGELVNFLNRYPDGRISVVPFNNNTISAYLNIIVSRLLNSGVKIFNIDYNNENDKIGLFLINHYHYAVANMNERGVILSRNPGIAPHRYPIIYSGKTKVSWDTLKYLPIYNNSASNIGVSWHAHALGGYYGGIEDDELYLRYIQFGTFSPIFILAGDTGKYYKREPWKWNQLQLTVIKEYMNLRNKLIPYIYNEGYNYHKYGVPIIQPLYYKYPKIYDEPNYINQYFFGSKIMISPIIKRKNPSMNRVVQKVFIPNGVWYEYVSGKKYLGNKYYTGFYKDEDYPIFIKEGSIIPMSLDENTNVPINMEIQVFPAENGLYGSYELYEDDGISKNIDKNYLITKMNLDKKENGYKFIIIRKDGNYNMPNRNYVLRFRNMLMPEKVTININNKFTDNYPFENDKSDLIIKLDSVNVYEPVEVNIIGKNIEIETVSVINEEIEEILEDLEINTLLKEKIDGIIFSDLPIKKQRIELRKLKKVGLEPKYINMLIGLLELIENK